MILLINEENSLIWSTPKLPGTLLTPVENLMYLAPHIMTGKSHTTREVNPGP